MILLPGAASAQAKRYPLESAERLRFHNVTAEPAMLQGKKGLKATISEEARRRMSQTQQYAQGLVCIEDVNFSNGMIPALLIVGAAVRGAQVKRVVGLQILLDSESDADEPTRFPTGSRRQSTRNLRLDHSI
jgi:hypothetical protein